MVKLGERAPFTGERRPPARRIACGGFASGRVGDRRSVGGGKCRGPGFKRDAIAGDGVFDGAERLRGGVAGVPG